MQPPDEKKGDLVNEKWEGRHGKSKHLPFHDRPGHDLSGCKTFLAKALEECTQWIKEAHLCFCCFISTHVTSCCNIPIKCTICGDRRHSALLHKERPPPHKLEPKSEKEGVNPKCTTLCGPSGGVSCSKTLLVDVYSKSNPHFSKRIYVIIDEQSNSCLVTSELADHVGARGPPEEEAGVIRVKDIFCESNFLTFNDFCRNSAIKTNFLTYYGLCNAIPQKWIRLLKESNPNTPMNSEYVGKIPLSKLSCKSVSRLLISQKFEPPTAERRMLQANLDEQAISTIYNIRTRFLLARTHPHPPHQPVHCYGEKPRDWRQELRAGPLPKPI